MNENGNGKVLVRSGRSYRISQIPVETNFDPGNYLLMVDGFGQYYMDKVDDFVFPKKVYGNTQALVERYIKGFESREGATGIFLCGIKGSGKTLTSQMLCKQLNLPVIIVNKPYHDNGFVQFLSELPGEFVVFFDEFEKVYSEQEHQNALLTLFDGNFKKKRLFLMTSNSENINFFLRNRPGRIFYKKNFPGIDAATIQEYLDDKLLNKDHIEGAIQLLQILENPSMDIMACLIEEMNRFNEEARVAASYMNIELESNAKYVGKVKATIDDKIYALATNEKFAHPYSKPEQSHAIRVRSFDGQFVTDFDHKKRLDSGDAKYNEEVYVNDLYLNIPAETWVAGPDNTFTAEFEHVSAGEDDDLKEVTFNIKIEIAKEQTWSYTF